MRGTIDVRAGGFGHRQPHVDQEAGRLSSGLSPGWFIRVQSCGVFDHRRWRFTRGITLGFIRGVRLERHPREPAYWLVKVPIRGSVGIPDSQALTTLVIQSAGVGAAPCRQGYLPTYSCGYRSTYLLDR